MLPSLKELLVAIVDYAGLFPPAQLSLPDAIAAYHRAQASPHAWMLDRFVVPAARLHELTLLLSQVSNSPDMGISSSPLPLSVILSQDWEAELQHLYSTIPSLIQTDSQQDSPLIIRGFEIAPLPPDTIQQVCYHLPPHIETFFEIPFDVDLDPYLKELQQTGTAAKLRTGGVTAADFPAVTQLSQRIWALATAQVPFKATAGLHHPLRSQRPLTDKTQSPTTIMHGFLNVAIAAAFAHQHSLTSSRLSIAELSSLLVETSSTAFQFTPAGITWNDRHLSLTDIATARRQCFRSFGSCSFEEPIADLTHLTLLSTPSSLPFSSKLTG